MSRSQSTRPPWVALAVGFALGAVAAGLLIAQPPRSGVGPAPSHAIPSAVGTLNSPAFVDSRPVPLGVYHLNQSQADRIARVIGFYAAYNDGLHDAAMSFVSDEARLLDCDYVTHEATEVSGRAGISSHVRSLMLDHDRWTVELYQDDPIEHPGQVVIYPIQRESDALRRLGAADGVKRSFPVALAMEVDEVGELSLIAWATGGPGVAKHLCTP